MLVENNKTRLFSFDEFVLNENKKISGARLNEAEELESMSSELRNLLKSEGEDDLLVPISKFKPQVVQDLFKTMEENSSPFGRKDGRYIDNLTAMVKMILNAYTDYSYVFEKNFLGTYIRKSEDGMGVYLSQAGDNVHSNNSYWNPLHDITKYEDVKGVKLYSATPSKSIDSLKTRIKNIRSKMSSEEFRDDEEYQKEKEQIISGLQEQIEEIKEFNNKRYYRIVIDGKDRISRDKMKNREIDRIVIVVDGNKGERPGLANMYVECNVMDVSGGIIETKTLLDLLKEGVLNSKIDFITSSALYCKNDSDWKNAFNGWKNAVNKGTIKNNSLLALVLADNRTTADKYKQPKAEDLAKIFETPEPIKDVKSFIASLGTIGGKSETNPNVTPQSKEK